jgi:hypothetical protein
MITSNDEVARAVLSGGAIPSEEIQDNAAAPVKQDRAMDVLMSRKYMRREDRIDAALAIHGMQLYIRHMNVQLRNAGWFPIADAPTQVRIIAGWWDHETHGWSDICLVELDEAKHNGNHKDRAYRKFTRKSCGVLIRSGSMPTHWRSQGAPVSPAAIAASRATNPKVKVYT